MYLFEHVCVLYMCVCVCVYFHMFDALVAGLGGGRSTMHLDESIVDEHTRARPCLGLLDTYTLSLSP
jgi:hypothetical protein